MQVDGCSAVPPLVSAVVLARNCDRDLPLALRSLAGWVDELVVVDGQSSDSTVAVARSFGAKVLVRLPSQALDADRAEAVAQCTGTWVLHLDADELVPPALGRRLRALAERDDLDAVEVHETSWFLGQPADVWTGWKLRMARRALLHVRPKVHDMFGLAPGARIVRVGDAPGERLLHYWTDGIEPLLNRMARYTLTEALQNPARAEPTARGLLRKALGAFRVAYFREGGRRHGWRGMYLSLHRAFYAATAEVAGHEAAQGGREAIRAAYRRHAEQVLAA